MCRFTEKYSIRIIRLNNLRREELERITTRWRLDEEQVKKAWKFFKDVCSRGDESIRDFYQDYYGLPRDTPIEVLEYEVKDAFKKTNDEIMGSLLRIRDRIKRFNKEILAGLKEAWMIRVEPGVYLGQIIRPIDRIAAYIPGGLYPYPSTALMTIVPARVAGCNTVLAASPPRGNGEPGIDPSIVVAAVIAGANKIYRLGGVQAAAAFACGTETVPRVDKIVGPGGPWFTAGKYLASSMTGIDMLAGPSEIMVLSDGTGDPGLIALDLLAQAEHGVLSSSILVTTSERQAESVAREIMSWLDKAPDKARETAWESLSRYGGIFIADNIVEAVDFINKYAPEHLEVIVSPENTWRVLEKIESAGTVFYGEYSATALGDYSLGSNHVLPTSGLARSRGGLSVLDYVKIIDVQYVEPEGLLAAGPDASLLAGIEGFFYHKKSIDARLDKIRGR
ncbi:MAG: histidinol dehydrogenase [Crenarchaeota archaeon]|nr:histidinol dehydrogenase [Thermoproteota archaeon]